MTTTADPHGLPALLRLEVGRFRASEPRRRRFEVSVHVGTPAEERVSVIVPLKVRPDVQLRVELMAALLESSDAAYAWMTRPGPTEVTEDDGAWLASAVTAYGMAGRELAGFFVLTREGWVDVRTSERRVWKRLRLDR